MSVRRWLVALSVACPPAGCGKPAASGPAVGAPATGPTAVKVVKPVRQALHWTVEQPGTLTAFEVTPVAAKLAGYVREIAPDPHARQQGRADAVIDIGSVVKKDQLLATLDIPELVEEAAQKRAAEDQAKAEREQVRKDLAVTDAQLAAARAMASALCSSPATRSIAPRSLYRCLPASWRNTMASAAGCSSPSTQPAAASIPAARPTSPGWRPWLTRIC